MPLALKQACERAARVPYVHGHGANPDPNPNPHPNPNPGPNPNPNQAASEQLEYHMFMGLFPQIHRAWMTIDHMLFLWDYTDPRGSFYQARGP